MSDSTLQAPPSRRLPLAPVLLATAIAVVALGGLGMVFGASAYDITDRGRDLFSYETGLVYEVRVADAVTLYVDSESRPNPDAITGPALVALSTAALMTLFVLATVGASRRLRWFYGLAAAGLAFLGVDELLGIHETLGHNLRFLAALPGIERPDDAIVAFYLVPAIAFVVTFRDIILSSRWAMRFFAAAVLCFFAAAASDVAGVSTDEPLELLSAAALVGGFASLLVGHVLAALAPLAPRAA